MPRLFKSRPAALIVWALVSSIGLILGTPIAAEADCIPNSQGSVFGNITDSGAGGGASDCDDDDDGDSGEAGNDGTQVALDPNEYAFAYACGRVDESALQIGQYVGDPCNTAVVACLRTGTGLPLTFVYSRPRGTTEPWSRVDATCGDRPIPGAPPLPPIPTLAQIRQAFTTLPFAKPTVNIQPEGDVTLVNLPTYFEAQWPASKLGPGDISKPIQLLSWSIEFRIDPAAYNYDFGDGTSSGPTADLGGPYPEGKIRHTYKQPNPAASVKVDAELTGSYRVNGGANWIPLNGVADLQNEPVVTLQVREAKSRLYGKQ